MTPEAPRPEEQPPTRRDGTGRTIPPEGDVVPAMIGGEPGSELDLPSEPSAPEAPQIAAVEPLVSQVGGLLVATLDDAERPTVTGTNYPGDLLKLAGSHQDAPASQRPTMPEIPRQP